ncbi:MAG TPA: hypothetical protein VG838_07570 [Opitutaceae bacterium]|nr:hypothetical protein [Opitutaceae bacterium]
MKTHAQRGSVLVTTLVFLTIIIIGAFAVFQLALNSFKNSERNELRARARAVAESELEYLYYNFEGLIVGGSSANNVPSNFSAFCDLSSTPTTDHPPFTAAHQAQNDGWVVRRSITFDQTVTGTIPGTTKTGTISYLTAKIEVVPGARSSSYNTLAVRVGRRFNNSTTSIFQYSIFFQGDLELAPSGVTTITGDIAANGSIYMGASSGGTLTINNQIRHLSGYYFNEDSAGAATYRKPGTWNAATGTIVTTDTTSLNAPLFGTSQISQSETMNSPENLLGGLDADALATSRNDLFGATDTPANLAIAENNVYRSLIAPPPSAASTDEYPTGTNLSTTSDDASLNALRAYTRAGVIITVGRTDNGDGTYSYPVTFTETRSGVSTTVPASTYAGVVTSTSMYDQREGKYVTITDIDVGALKTKLSASFPNDASGQPTFNGLLYVNLKDGVTTNPAAVRLNNAATTPGVDTGSGFSVATNGGLYVRGSYNTTPYVDPNTGVSSNNPCMLMSDALTILSSSWNDANAGPTSDISQRVATTGTTTINSGILTGNVPASATVASGGAQNLVRFLENWTDNSGNKGTVTFNGSLGRLFSSKYFTAAYQQPGQIYTVPNRNFTFNTAMKTKRPPGSPTITAFSRGTFFTW